MRCARLPAPLLFTPLLLLLSPGRVRAAEPLPLPHRLFYLSSNLLTDANIDKAAALFARAEKSGYTGVVLTDSKFARLAAQPPAYFRNVERLKAAAAGHHLEIIPCVFPLGWSNDLLANNPNLAEGLPVKAAPFVVKGGEARIAADAAPAFQPIGNLGAWSWHDPTVSYDAADRALVLHGTGANARAMQPLALAPWREYRITARIKTSAFKGTPEIKVLTKRGGEPLTFTRWTLPATAGWTTCTLLFNSLDHTDANLYVGAWSPTAGTAAIADLRIEAVGLLNALRRTGTPLIVTTNDGKPLVEGKDFAPYSDPKMGVIPWPGEYDVAHDAPPLKLLTHLPDNTPLRVSWFHPMIVETGSVMICPSEPETLALLKDNATRVHSLFHATSYFMAHDEIRVMNWCDACQSRHLSPGQLLADSVRSCTALMKEIAPEASLYVWSDMFDPNHNARDHYYLVNGTLAGSWEGLDPHTTIALWYAAKAPESMKFFTSRGHDFLIAGYYDAPLTNILPWLQAARTFPTHAAGTMYTTWENNFTQLEAFNTLVTRSP